MAFPIDRKYIQEAELSLGFEFPDDFKDKMEKENGGSFETDDDELFLFPFPDTEDEQRRIRTLTNIISETVSAKEWEGFPENAVAVGDNGSGDILIFLPSVTDPTKLDNRFYMWRHETSRVEEVPHSIQDLMESAS